jgi:protein-tyrosine phosphatase
MARPRGGDWLLDEIARFRRDGIDIVVSLLEAHEVVELDLLEEADACLKAGVQFISFPIPDRGVPDSTHELLDLARSLADDLGESRNIAIHCRAGIGRASLLAATLMALGGVGVAEAFSRISDARGLAVPDTPEQVVWVGSVIGRFA